MNSVEGWPIVGREPEIAHLRALLLDGATPGVVLAGRPGVGKSRLVTECLRMAEVAGLATVHIVATRAARRIPFGALDPLLVPAPEADEMDRVSLLRRSADAIVRRGHGRRVLLAVDDAHLLDEGSAALIDHLIATNAAFTLLAIRTGEAATPVVTSPWRERLIERIDLAGLDAESLRELLALVLGGPVDPAASNRIAARSGGNVLFLRELALGALHDGSLQNEGGLWRLVGRLSPSDRLAELVENRLAHLGSDERDLLELIAVGEMLGTAELEALGDLAVAERLERERLIESGLDRRRLVVRLGHPIYGDVLRRQMTAMRTRTLANQLATVIEQHGARRREDVLLVATWRLDTGGVDPEVMLTAATVARRRYDFVLAERLARAAVDAGAGFDAELLAAELVSLQGRGEEADAKLAALAVAATDDRERTLAALRRIDNAVWGMRRGLDPVRIAEDAEAAVTDPCWRDEITARRAWAALHRDGPSAAAAIAVPVAMRSQGRALVSACQSAAYSLVRLGRLDEAIELAVRGRDEHLAIGTIPGWGWHPWVFDYFECRAIGYAGDLRASHQRALALHRQAVDDGSLEAQALFAMLLAQFVGERGHPSNAARYAREAAGAYRELGRPVMVKDCLAFAAYAFALAGSADRAAATLEEVQGIDEPAPTYIALFEHEARAWTAVAGGGLRSAQRRLLAAADMAEAMGDLVGAATVLHGLARLGVAATVSERLASVAARIDGRLAQARADHAAALVRSDGPALEKVGAAFDQMGAELLAAEAMADAAVAWRRDGNTRRATAAEQRASVLWERCERPITPALLGTSPRVQLSIAERETAMLAANGLTNRQIADELHLSSRTVENRLQHVYVKLGIENLPGSSCRDQLRRMLSSSR